jgi:putative Mg2+ transporter-C (MgtC) family protein
MPGRSCTQKGLSSDDRRKELFGQEETEILLHLGSALLAGSLIGLERSFHARPAGFRTHALVCLASAALMLVTLYQPQWMTNVPIETIRIDPTRMAQGIMTGIGFLGAGVIFKEGLTVRGLTTAASIWMTAALGILYGIGFYFPAVVATIATLAILGAFRLIEAAMPTQFFAHHTVRFRKHTVLPEPELRKILDEEGFSVSHMSYRLDKDGADFEYRMVLRSSDRSSAERLASRLASMDVVQEFRISPTGD